MPQIRNEAPPSRANLKDQAAVFIARWSLPAIVTMVVIMVFSAMFIEGDSIGIVSAMITAVVGGLIVVLQQMTGADQEDPMSVIARELIDNLKNVEERNAALSQQLIENLKRSEERNSTVSQELIAHIQAPRSISVDGKGVSLVDGTTETRVGE